MRSRALWLVLFLASLHLLILMSIWRGSLGRIAVGVVLVSFIPLVMSAAYLLPRIGRPMSWLDLVVALYAAWSVASLLLYFQPSNPSQVGAYAFGLYHFVLPIACYFAMKSIPREQHRTVISGLVALNTFALAYGIYLYTTRPAFYLNYLTDRLSQGGQMQEWQYFARLQSYLGSTSVGYISAVSLVLATLATPRVRRLLPMLLPLFVAGAALSLQRASLVAVVMALAYLTFLARTGAMLRVVIGVTIAVTLVYGAMRLEGGFRQRLQSRATTEMVEGAEGFFAERGYRYGMEYLRRFPLGVGVGATSSAAANAGMLSRIEVADANFMRIAADLGPQGLLLFLGVLGIAYARGWRSPRRAGWMTLLTIHCGIMLTTNVFDSFYVSHSFWIVLGLIDIDAEDVVPAVPREHVPFSGVPATAALTA